VQGKKKTSSNLRYPMFSGGEKNNIHFSSVIGNSKTQL
jgi:hypothetical protein